MLVEGVRLHKLYEMKFRITETVGAENSEELAQADITCKSFKDWHEKILHQNYGHVKKVLKHFNISVENKDAPFCEPCTMGKIHRLPFPLSTTTTTRIGDLLHSDLCDPMRTSLLGGTKYFLLFSYDFLRYHFIYFLKNKCDVVQHMDCYFKKAEKHSLYGL